MHISAKLKLIKVDPFVKIPKKFTVRLNYRISKYLLLFSDQRTKEWLIEYTNLVNPKLTI